MTRFHRLLSMFLAAFCCACPALVAGSVPRVNKEVGYRIRVPEDFSEGQPAYRVVDGKLLSFDPYLLELFTSEKPLRTRSGGVFRSQLTTYFFPERSALEAKEEVGTGKLFRSFRDYAAERIKGFFFASEEELKVSGFAATVYEMQFEKLTGIPKRYQACTFQIPGGEFAMLFTCTEEHFRESRPAFHNSFSSFRLLESTGLNPPQMPAPKEQEKAEPEAEVKLTRERMIELRDAGFLAAIETLPEGWRHQRSEHFLILYRASPIEVRKVERHIEAVWSWLSENFSPLGDGPVQEMIVRVAREGQEIPPYEAADTSKPGSVQVIDLMLRGSDRRGSNLSGLNQRLFGLWLRQRNEALLRRFPTWLGAAFNNVIGDAELKGSRLEFPPDGGETWRMKSLQGAYEEYRKTRKGDVPLIPLKDLLGPRSEEILSGGRNRNASTQATVFLRYLLDGPGSKRPETEVLLWHYLGHLNDLVKELEETLAQEKKEQEELEKLKESMTEEQLLELEDEQYRKKRENTGKLLLEELGRKLFERTFAQWTEKDWDAVDKGTRLYLKRLAD